MVYKDFGGYVLFEKNVMIYYDIMDLNTSYYYKILGENL